MKQLSVIIPVYNVEKYVYECVDSVFRQGLDENIFEVIIVNDGTMDNSMSVIKELIASHSNIIVISQENQGLSVARNKGLAIAEGEYILMPDSDDLLIENSLYNLKSTRHKPSPHLLAKLCYFQTSRNYLCVFNMFLKAQIRLTEAWNVKRYYKRLAMCCCFNRLW